MQPEFMQKALDIAKHSGNDIPIGAVIVRNNEIIVSAVNEREKKKKTIAHAEMLAIERANEKLENKRLSDCEIYVTLEPCPMCASAILQSGIKAVYFGAFDTLYGAFGSKIDMRRIMNIQIEIKGGIMEEECSKTLKEYFKRLREK